MKHGETPNDEILAVTNVDLVGADRPSPRGGLAEGNAAEAAYYRGHKMLRNVTPPVTPCLERGIFFLITLCFIWRARRDSNSRPPGSKTRRGFCTVYAIVR